MDVRANGGHSAAREGWRVNDVGIADRVMTREREQVVARLEADWAADVGRPAELPQFSTPKLSTRRPVATRVG